MTDKELELIEGMTEGKDDAYIEGFKDAWNFFMGRGGDTSKLFDTQPKPSGQGILYLEDDSILISPETSNLIRDKSFEALCMTNPNDTTGYYLMTRAIYSVFTYHPDRVNLYINNSIKEHKDNK